MKLLQIGNTVHPPFSGPRLTGRVQQGGTFNYLV